MRALTFVLIILSSAVWAQSNSLGDIVNVPYLELDRESRDAINNLMGSGRALNCPGVEERAQGPDSRERAGVRLEDYESGDFRASERLDVNKFGVGVQMRTDRIAPGARLEVGAGRHGGGGARLRVPFSGF